MIQRYIIEINEEKKTVSVQQTLPECMERIDYPDDMWLHSIRLSREMKTSSALRAYIRYQEGMTSRENKGTL